MKLTVDQALRKAATLALKGRRNEAREAYRAILQAQPDNARAAQGLQALTGNTATTSGATSTPAPIAAPSPEPIVEAVPQAELDRLVTIFNADRLDEAVQLADMLLARDGNLALAHNVLGVIDARAERFEDALARFDRVLQLAPDANAHNNRANVLHNLGRHEEAVESYQAALALAPDLVDAHFSMGNSLKEIGRLEDAIASYQAALRLDPNRGIVWYNCGNTQLALERREDALESYDRTVALLPDFAEAYNNRGNLLRTLGRSADEVLESYDNAVRAKPDLGSAHNNRALLLKEMGRLDEAMAAADLAVALDPDDNSHSNRGLILSELKRFQEALEEFDAAVRLKPDSASIYNNAGNALQDLERPEEAILCYNAAIEFAPDLVDAYANRANAFGKLDRLDESIASYAEALRRKPDLAPAQSLMLYQKAQICDWSEPEVPVDLATLGIEGDPVGPFSMLSLEDDPGRQLARARHWTRNKLPVGEPALPAPATRPARLKIGYFSADFHDHATMWLMAKLFEKHDRERFEWHGFSYGPDKRDWMQKRAEAAFDHYHDIRGLTDIAAAQLSRDLGIDIAVDLKGYTRDTRSAIFAHRAAPVQISYIGFPGSMGADFIDYIVADKVVIPPELREFYDEKVIALPHSYQSNDDTRVISQAAIARADLGLPENGFVFCCFNNNYKISSKEFDIWMRLLAKVEGGVLWLLEGNQWARDNLRREAKARGIDPNRLVFASRLVSPEHLARHRCADLFLDTFNYNAHTTGSDALWAGLPIVTLLGRTFAARVGGSLLEAVGLSELVTHSAEEYEALALALATDAPRLAAIRAKLAANLPSAPLFDTERFARDIERAYDLAFERRMAGLAPDHIDVPASSPVEIPA